MIALETKVSDLTLAQLFECLDEHLAQTGRPLNSSTRKIIGIKGLADYLGCSERSAHRLKASGRIDKAIIQDGRKIVIHEDVLNKILGRKC